MRAIDILIAAVVIGCGANTNDAAPAGSGSAAQPAPAPVAPASRSARQIAIVRADRMWEECSNAGGGHVSFVIDGPGPVRYAHGGGHGRYLAMGPSVSGPQLLPKTWWVAELFLAQSPPASQHSACLDDMPGFHAEALRLWAATDRDDARAIAAVAAAHTAALTKTASTASVTVARVRSIDTYPKYVMHTESIAGTAPTGFEIPSSTIDHPFYPSFGDIVVIASDARGTPTRVLVARDRADAMERAAAIRLVGWRDIAASTYGSWSGGLFDVQGYYGEVTSGSPKCGQDVVIAPAPNHPYDPLRHAAAPPGAAVGDTLSMAVEWQPTDACGRELRILRAYRVPRPGSPQAQAAAPLAPPLVE